MAYNLPWGVSLRDIDIACGAYNADCLGCGVTYQACELNEDGLCDQCVEAKEQQEKESEE